VWCPYGLPDYGTDDDDDDPAGPMSVWEYLLASPQ
jgi:hypothetical protein